MPDFVALSKVLDLAVAPLSWALALVALALVAVRRSPRRSAWLLGAALLVLYVFSVEPVSDAIQRRMEASARTTLRPGVTYDAVVVLSGMVDAEATRASGRTELTGAADRIVAAFELLREGRARLVVLSGGDARPSPGDVGEAELLARKLVAWGIPPERIVAEARSRNTHENAVEVARLVAARGLRSLLLVTSAMHQARALACFERVGLEPDTFPVDRRAGGGERGSWLPRVGNLERSTEALRELTGRLVYRAVGYA